MTTAVATPRTWRKPPFIANPRWRWAIGIGVATYLAAALGTLEVDWGRVIDGLPRGRQFIAAFFPPDFVSRWAEIVDGIYESLWMTVTSTVIGILISIPVGPARTSPKQRAMRPIFKLSICLWLKWKKRSVRAPSPSLSTTSQLRRRPRMMRLSVTWPCTRHSWPTRSARNGTIRVRSW